MQGLALGLAVAAVGLAAELVARDWRQRGWRRGWVVCVSAKRTVCVGESAGRAHSAAASSRVWHARLRLAVAAVGLAAELVARDWRQRGWRRGWVVCVSAKRTVCVGTQRRCIKSRVACSTQSRACHTCSPTLLQHVRAKRRYHLHHLNAEGIHPCHRYCSTVGSAHLSRPVRTFERSIVPVC